MPTPHHHANAIFHLSAEQGSFKLSLTENGIELGSLEGYLAPHWVSVQSVEVLESARRQGIGTRLVKHLEERAASLGCRVCHVQLFHGFDAQPFFAEMGYAALPANMATQGDVARVYMDRLLPQTVELLAA